MTTQDGNENCTTGSDALREACLAFGPCACCKATVASYLETFSQKGSPAGHDQSPGSEEKRRGGKSGSTSDTPAKSKSRSFGELWKLTKGQRLMLSKVKRVLRALHRSGFVAIRPSSGVWIIVKRFDGKTTIHDHQHLPYVQLAWRTCTCSTRGSWSCDGRRDCRAMYVKPAADGADVPTLLTYTESEAQP